MAAQQEKARIAFRIKAITILVLLPFLGYAGLSLTSTNTFCGMCHEMDPAVVSWQKSSHREVKCVACHIGPGFVNTIIHKVASVKSLYYHFAGGYENPINEDGGHAKEVKDDYCLQCHEGIFSPEQFKKDLKADIKPAHEKHRKLGHQCTNCHNRIAHPLDGYQDKSKMKACLDCHPGSGLGENCNLCHSDRFLLEKNK